MTTVTTILQKGNGGVVRNWHFKQDGEEGITEKENAAKIWRR